MAEVIAGLAVASSIITVIDTTCKVVATGWKCYRGIKNPPKELAEVLSELMSLKGILDTLHSHLSTSYDNSSKDLLGLEVLNQPGGVLSACAAVLQDVLQIIEGLQKKKLSSIIASATSGQKFLETKGRIERLKGLLILALSSDHMTLAHAIEKYLHDSFGELQQGQEKIHRELLTIDNHISKLSRASDEIASSQEKKQKAERYYKTLRWLSEIDFEANHSNACKLQQPGTGLWLTKGKDFLEWAEKGNSTFWLHAIPGAGKTILCSTVIQELESKCEPIANKPDKLAVPTTVYFYFDFRNSEQQHTEGMLCSLLCQLADKLAEVPGEICGLWEIYKDKTTRPSPEELLSILKIIIREYFDKVYIALDALDECSERHLLLPILHELMDSRCASIFLTSRSEHDIRKSLSQKLIYSAAIESADVALDVELFVSSQIKSMESLRDLNAALQNEIVEHLVNGAKGMFRWVVCQLDALKPLGRPKAIRNALKGLPQTLDETYDRILTGIQSDEEKEFIRRTLQFIIFAARPMTMEEISEAVVIEDGATALDPDDRFHTPDHLVKNVRSLLTTTGEYLGLSHYSVQEYLQSPRIFKGPASYFTMNKSNADEEIGRRCLTYLAYDDFNIGPCKYRAEFEQRLMDYPFFEYAANYWFVHSREEQAQRSVACLFNKIWTTAQSPKYLSWHQEYSHRADRFRSLVPNWSYAIYLTTNPPIYYYPALWGLHILLSCLLTEGTYVNIKGGHYGQALQAACASGNYESFQLLLDHGADVHAQGGPFGNALQASAFGGNEDMVKTLIERNCRVGTVGGKYGFALYAASSCGHTGTACMLLEAGADVNQNGPDGYALHAAASGGHYHTCEALINRGAVVNARNLVAGSVLEQAASEGQLHIAELLIERGAEVNYLGTNALFAACDAGHEEVVRLLLIHGADVCRSSNDNYSRTPMRVAAMKGHTRVISLLVKYGADVNEQGGGNGNALQAASCNGHGKTAGTLLDLGADVNRVGGYYGCALQAACESRLISIVKMLLDHGANPNIQFGIYGNPLQAAACGNQADMVELLLERGAKVNAVGGESHTALHAAASQGYENIVEILLKAGADVGIVGGEYGSALDAAISRGYINVAERLRNGKREWEEVMP